MNTEEKQKSRGWFYHFFWWAGGADKDILYQCPKREHERMLSIGITVLFTAVLAFLSGYFALKTIVDNDTYVLIIAIFWGLVIFNLDRIIVMGIHKDKDNKKRKEIKSAIPRFILAGIIAVVVSKPIEVELFKKQIDFEQKELLKEYNSIDRLRRAKKYDLKGKDSVLLKAENREKYLKSILGLNEPTYDTMYNNIIKKIKTLEIEVADLEAKVDSTEAKRINQYYDIPMKRGDPIIENDSIKGYKEVKDYSTPEAAEYRTIKAQKKKYVDDLKRKRDNLKTEKDSKEERKTELEKENKKNLEITEKNIETATKEKEQAKDASDEEGIIDSERNKAFSEGFFGKSAALSSLAKKEKAAGKPMLYYAQIFIFILFLVLELAPSLAKILHSRGPYDDIVDNQDEEYKNLKDVNLSKILDTMGIQRKMNLQKMNNEFETQTNQFAFFTECSHQLFEEMGKAHTNLVSKLGELNTGFNSRYMKEIEMLMQQKFNAFKEKQADNFSSNDAQQTYTSQDTRDTNTNNASRTEYVNQDTGYSEKDIDRGHTSAEASNDQDTQGAEYSNAPFDRNKNEENQQSKNNARSSEEPTPFFGDDIATSGQVDDEKSRFSFLDRIVNFFKNLFTKNNQNDA